MTSYENAIVDLEALRAIIVVELTRGAPPTLRQAAVLARVSSGTLQRQLGREGTTFSHFLRGVRCEAAISMLQGTDMPISAIAASLGFSEPSAFSRAFRRWTGVRPTDARKKARG